MLGGARGELDFLVYSFIVWWTEVVFRSLCVTMLTSCYNTQVWTVTSHFHMSVVTYWHWNVMYSDSVCACVCVSHWTTMTRQTMHCCTVCCGSASSGKVCPTRSHLTGRRRKEMKWMQASSLLQQSRPLLSMSCGVFCALLLVHGWGFSMAIQTTAEYVVGGVFGSVCCYSRGEDSVWLQR